MAQCGTCGHIKVLQNSQTYEDFYKCKIKNETFNDHTRDGCTDDYVDQYVNVEKKGNKKDNIVVNVEEKIPDEVQKIINEIAEDFLINGDPIKKILDVHQTLHVGDRNTAETLLVSMATTSIDNCEGIQPKVSGDSGKGKTHCTKAMVHLIPKKYMKVTTLSNKVILYLDIPPGTILFCDDIELSEILEGIIKRSTTNFQSGSHYTTMINMEPVELFLNGHIAWWLTSVNDDQGAQLLNRQFGGGVDESHEQDVRVAEYQQKKAVTGDVALPENADVLICRAIIEDIKSNMFKVRTPFASEIDFGDVSNRRNVDIFLDMVKAYTVLRYRQRYIDDDGFLISSVDDYDDAKRLYETRGKNQGLKLTDAELRVSIILSTAGEVDANELMKLTGLSQGRISQLINGHKDRPESGLKFKLKGLVEEKRSVKIDQYNTRQVKYYSLTGFKPLSSFDNILALKEDVKTRYSRYYPDIRPILADETITSRHDISYISYYYSKANKIEKYHSVCVKAPKIEKLTNVNLCPKTANIANKMTTDDVSRANIMANITPNISPSNNIKQLDTNNPSQKEVGVVTMEIIDDWYPERPPNPSDSKNYIIPELVRVTGITPDAAFKHVTEAFKVKGW